MSTTTCGKIDSTVCFSNGSREGIEAIEAVTKVLAGRVSEIRAAGAGKGRVQVSPELIDVRTGASKWQQSFDGDVTDVFQVQTTIAAQVASGLVNSAGSLGHWVPSATQDNVAEMYVRPIFLGILCPPSVAA